VASWFSAQSFLRQLSEFSAICTVRTFKPEGRQERKAVNPSLIAQRFDRIQICRLPRGVDAEEQALARRRRNSKNRPKRGHARGQGGPDRGNDPGNYRSDKDANDSAHGRQGDRLQRELQQDVAFAGADGLAYADFPGALGDRDQHDIHHPDAAHDQAYAGDSEHKNKYCSSYLVPHIYQRILREDGEIVGLVGWNSSTPAQEFPHLIDSFRHVCLRRRLDADPILL